MDAGLIELDIEEGDADLDEDQSQVEAVSKIQKEKQKLLASLESLDFSGLKAKVAHVLNMYPQTRNSDVTLSLKLWEIFQPDIYNPHGILPLHLFKLERVQYIVRARAKIQNEYGLFQAEDSVKRKRRKQEELMEEAVLQDVVSRKIVNVYSDESGKTQKYVSVSSVWVLEGRTVFTLNKAIEEWKEVSSWKTREVHFSHLRRDDFETLKEYLGIILANRQFVSFKTINIERAKTARKVEQIVEKLHEHMLIRGVGHEVYSGRIDLPREIEVLVDEEQALDRISLEEMERNVASALNEEHGNGIAIRSIKAVSSKKSSLIQLADLIGGALNRRLNHDGERNFKDDMADMIITMLDLKGAEENVEGLDAIAYFRF